MFTVFDSFVAWAGDFAFEWKGKTLCNTAVCVRFFLLNHNRIRIGLCWIDLCGWHRIYRDKSNVRAVCAAFFYGVFFSKPRGECYVRTVPSGANWNGFLLTSMNLKSILANGKRFLILFNRVNATERNSIQNIWLLACYVYCRGE